MSSAPATTQDTRARILAEAWRLMEERRGNDVTVGDVAHAAGVSRQAVYLHFPSRAALLIATVRYVDELKGCDERLAQFSTATQGVEALEAFVDFWGNYIPEIYGLAKALLAVRDTDQDAAAAWADRMEALRTGGQCVVTALERDGMLAPGMNVDEASDLLWALLSIDVWEGLTIDRGWSTSQYIRWMKVVLTRAFVKPA